MLMPPLGFLTRLGRRSYRPHRLRNRRPSGSVEHLLLPESIGIASGITYSEERSHGMSQFLRPATVLMVPYEPQILHGFCPKSGILRKRLRDIFGCPAEAPFLGEEWRLNIHSMCDIRWT